MYNSFSSLFSSLQLTWTVFRLLKRNLLKLHRCFQQIYKIFLDNFIEFRTLRSKHWPGIQGRGVVICIPLNLDARSDAVPLLIPPVNTAINSYMSRCSRICAVSSNSRRPVKRIGCFLHRTYNLGNQNNYGVPR